MSDVQRYDSKITWRINPSAPDDSFEAKAPFVDNGINLISKERYFSIEWMARERTRLWPKVWLWAAREEDISESGDFKTFTIGKESFIVVRGNDDRIRAFFNVCSHRGNRLVSSEDGALPNGVTCPFHGWEFALDGQNTKVTDRETFRPEALCRDLNLSEVRCESWEGFVFINMDTNATPLIEHLGPLPAHAAPYRLRDMRIVHRVQAVWDANWKLGMDGFHETYHVHAIHPQILPLFNDYEAQIDLYPRGMARAITKFANRSPRLTGSDSDGLNTSLREALTEVGLDPSDFEGRASDVREAIQKTKRKRALQLGLDYSAFLDGQLTDDWAYTIFPNVILGLHTEGVNLLYFRPHESDPRRFILDSIVLMHPQVNPALRPPAYMGVAEDCDISGRNPATTKVVDWHDGGFGEVFDQDAGLFAQVQKGVESIGFRGAALSSQEMRIGHFHAELDRYLEIAT